MGQVVHIFEITENYPASGKKWRNNTVKFVSGDVKGRGNVYLVVLCDLTFSEAYTECKHRAGKLTSQTKFQLGLKTTCIHFSS